MSLAVDSYSNSEKPRYNNTDDNYHISYKYATYIAKKNSDLSGMFDPETAAKTYFGATGKHMQDFQARKRSMEGKSAGIWGFEGILDFLENPDETLSAADAESGVGSTKERAYNTKLSAGNISVSEFGAPSSGVNTQAYAEEIARDITEFTKQLEKAVASIKNMVGNNLKSYKDLIIAEFCMNEGIPASSIGRTKFTQAVIQNFLTHQGIKRLNLGAGSELFKDKALQSVANQCILLLEALPDYGEGGSSTLEGGKSYSTGSTKNGHADTSLDVLNVMVRKFRGLFSNVVGKAGELAWAVAEEAGAEAIRKGLKQLPLKDKTYTGPDLTITAKVVGGEVVKSEKSKTGYTVSKPDVDIAVTINGVTIHYGASVKQYKADPSTDPKAGVDIVSGTSFWTALLKYINNSNSAIKYVFNVAGARSGSAGRGNARIEGPDESDLVQRWDDIKKTVTIANFLDFLSGEVATANAVSAIYLVVNGKVYSISRILEKITIDNLSTTISAKIGNSVKSLNRNNMAIKHNKWKKKGNSWASDAILANERSKEVQSGIIDTLTAAKMQVSLSNLMNFI